MINVALLWSLCEFAISPLRLVDEAPDRMDALVNGLE